MKVTYVLDKNGSPLMPIRKAGRVRRMLKEGRAHVEQYVPFTIRLLYDIENPVVDDVLLGIDPGRTNIGLCAVDSKGHILYASDVETRNKTIAKLMLKRKAMRQASRRGERKVRQRRAIASDKTGMAKHTEFWRMLPGYKEPICCKNIRNTEARFNHRTRPEGWLTPTANHLLQTHMNAVNLVRKVLPVSGIVIEINRFDFAKMENPGIRNWEYQKGKLFGFRNRNDAVASQQDNVCLLCQKHSIDHFHHIVPRHQNGSESIDNIAGLCSECHAKVHTDPKAKDRLQSRKAGLLKKYHALSVINQIMKRLLEELAGILPTYVTTGHETKATRILLGLSKEHHLDAYCIAVSQLDAMPEADTDYQVFRIRQFRRHDRANIHAQTERAYYYNGKQVAKNRTPRFEQKDDALSDWYEKQVATYGRRQADRMRSQLVVKKSIRHYNNKDRIMPGAVFLYKGKRHVMSGQITNGLYLWAVGDTKTNYPARDCRIISRNTGLVYL